MNVSWPESIDERGLLSRGKYFRVGRVCGDLIRTRNAEWAFGVVDTGATYVSTTPTTKRTVAIRRRALRISAFGRTLIVAVFP